MVGLLAAVVLAQDFEPSANIRVHDVRLPMEALSGLVVGQTPNDDIRIDSILIPDMGVGPADYSSQGFEVGTDRLVWGQDCGLHIGCDGATETWAWTDPGTGQWTTSGLQRIKPNGETGRIRLKTDGSQEGSAIYLNFGLKSAMGEELWATERWKTPHEMPVALTAKTTALAIEHPNVLAFSKTAAFRHDSIPAAHDALRKLAAEKGFKVTSTEDASWFTDDRLRAFDVVVFLMTTGDVLDPGQQAAMERFVRSGKGYVGIHAAADTEYDWPWYGRLVGAYFQTHDAPHEERMRVFDRAHPSTTFLPSDWTRFDEWYKFKAPPAPEVRVLMAWEEGEKTGAHPVSWCHEFDGGRAWYNAMGHTASTYQEELFLENLYQGILWTANARPLEGATAPDWSAGSGWKTADGFLENPAKGKNLASGKRFGDQWLHAEFKIPKGGNSGVYLQGRYEVQIEDSHGKASKDLDFPDAGGLMYGEAKGREYPGAKPMREAARPAGQWNTLDVLFRAPRFDTRGRKTEDARFVEVRLNGVVVQSEARVSGPSKGAEAQRESPLGPLVLQGTYGPVSFRNVLVKALKL